MNHLQYLASILLLLLVANSATAQDDGSALILGEEKESAQEADSIPPELERFVRDLLAVVARKDARDLSRLIDWENVLDQALEGLPQGESYDGFRRGFLDTIEGPGGLPARIVDAISKGGSLTFLRMMNRDDEDFLLFRLTLPEGGFNYIEFKVIKGENDRFRIVDVYPYSNGELVSVTLRRAYLPIAAGADEDKLQEKERLLRKHAQELSRFAELVSANEAERAMEIYEKLPEPLQFDKSSLLLRLRATQQLKDDQYREALAAIRERYPDDPSADLLAIDAYLLAKNYEAAMACINRLDDRVNGDPYLDLQRAAIRIMQQRWDEAARFARLAIKDPNSKLEAFWTLVTISLGREKPAETLRLLKQMDQEFEMEWSDLSTIPDYATFVKTSQYSQWLKYLNER